MIKYEYLPQLNIFYFRQICIRPVKFCGPDMPIDTQCQIRTTGTVGSGDYAEKVEGRIFSSKSGLRKSSESATLSLILRLCLLAFYLI